MTQGEGQKATELLAKVLSKDPHHIKTLLKLAEVHTILKQETGRVAAYDSLCEAYSRAGDFQKAVSVAEQLVEIDPESSQHKDRVKFFKSKLARSRARPRAGGKAGSTAFASGARPRSTAEGRRPGTASSRRSPAGLTRAEGARSRASSEIAHLGDFGHSGLRLVRQSRPVRFRQFLRPESRRGESTERFGLGSHRPRRNGGAHPGGRGEHQGEAHRSRSLRPLRAGGQSHRPTGRRARELPLPRGDEREARRDLRRSRDEPRGRRAADAARAGLRQVRTGRGRGRSAPGSGAAEPRSRFSGGGRWDRGRGRTRAHSRPRDGVGSRRRGNRDRHRVNGGGPTRLLGVGSGFGVRHSHFVRRRELRRAIDRREPGRARRRGAFARAAHRGRLGRRRERLRGRDQRASRRRTASI